MVEQTLKSILWLLIYPGFIFTLVIGVVASFVVRKVTALVQWRIGPPILKEGRIFQSLYDIMKLLGKETLIPRDAQKLVFMSAPLVGFAGVLLLSTMLWKISFTGQPFIGDIIVAIYLMVLPSLALILGSSASASPHASVGTGREMKLVMSYELPLVLALIVVIIKAGGTLDLTAIAANKPVLSISGFLAFFVALLCVQAKLGFVPFDIAEAETELGSGVLMEYSGALLAIWKIMQAMMLVALPLFLVMMFLGGFHVDSGGALFFGILKYVLILVLIILIKNTNPRVRIDQAMKFFWVYCGIALVIAVILAMIGNYYNISWL
ncbi:MAG: complex I subunit 1 family protein [Planctomycetota bacterium]|jgi:NADH-quinone oxidoreductase subunit H